MRTPDGAAGKQTQWLCHLFERLAGRVLQVAAFCDRGGAVAALGRRLELLVLRAASKPSRKVTIQRRCSKSVSHRIVHSIRGPA